MKSLALTAIAAIGIATSTPVFAKDACETILCMAGLLQGKGVVSNCSSAVSDYFSILSYRHGHVDLSGTANSRASFLSGCANDPDGWASKIGSAYGAATSY